MQKGVRVICEVCKKLRFGCKPYRTLIKRRTIDCCPECKAGMDWTARCIKISTDWFLQKRGNQEKYRKLPDSLVLMPLA